eukprot:11178008-Lingulodinium_polyedra.AAC.1
MFTLEIAEPKPDISDLSVPIYLPLSKCIPELALKVPPIACGPRAIIVDVLARLSKLKEPRGTLAV